eukprot:TRINITY_DN549_c0_g2_i1.p1 TRINITY_DN549_c0_g2~~TRINITY_DN549_c0_g2_i1.p1  ORF type:complete len:382 (+),score=73.75 TRINITY_DN549_c0_g2_i1:57-1202(+)
MKIAIVLLLISFALLSCVEGTFVFDRRLLNSTRRRLGRDFSGSVRYGKFSYLGACPTGSGAPLPHVKITKVGAGAETCFSETLSGSGDSIGYICQPTSGGSGIIHFGYPGTDGFVIGGALFGGSVGSGDSYSGATTFVWGQVGSPSYSGEATTSCSTGCTASYCTTSCEVSCTASTSIAAASVSCSTNTGSGAGTVYFVPSGADSSYSNCGSPDDCCSGSTFFSYCQSESLITGTFSATYTTGPVSPPVTAEYGITFIPSVDGVIAGVTYNADSITVNSRTVSVWGTGVSPLTTFISESGSGLLKTILNPPISVSSGTVYIVSFPISAADPSSFYFEYSTPVTNGRYLTSNGPFYTLTTGSKPDTAYNQFAPLDIIFNPCS